MPNKQKKRAKTQMKLAQIMRKIHPEVSYIGVTNPETEKETRIKVPKNKDQK